MSYQFSLSKILDLKEKEKEQLQNSLASSMQILDDENLIHSSLLDRKAEVDQLVIESQETSINISSLIGLHNYQQRLMQTITQSKQRVVKAEKDVDRKRKQVIDKAKEAKTYQLLKAREFARYVYEQNRIEQNQLDEISVNQYLKEAQSKQS